MNLPAPNRTYTAGFTARPKSSQQRPFTSSSRKKAPEERIIKEEVMDQYGPSLDKYFIESLMGGEDLNTEELKELLKDFILQPRFAHGEIIQENEPYFRCLDCEVLKNTNQRTYLCRSCFEKTNHKGHRFLLFNDATGYETCDCGNEGLLDSRFFCPDHGTCTKDDYQRVISVFPPNYLKNFNKVIKKIIYDLVFVCELHQRGLHPNMKDFIDKVMEALLAAIRYCLNLNSIFVVLIAEIITQAMKHPKSFKKRSYLIEGTYIKHNKQLIEDNVTHTYLENLLRYSFSFKKDSQKEFREILLKLACAEEFKKKLVLSFHNTIHHLFSIKPLTLFGFSDLVYLTTQIYAPEENCLRVIKESSFDKMIETLRRYGKYYQPGLDPEGEILTRCLHGFELILEKENPGRKLVEKEGVVGQFLDVIIEFQQTHSYEFKELPEKLRVMSHVESILNYWDFEEQVFEVIEKLVRNAGYILDKVGWDQDPGLFLIDWGERANRDIEINCDKGKVHLSLPLQRSMVAYLQSTLDRIDKNIVMKQLEYIRRSAPEAVSHLIGQAIRTIGAMRQSMIKIKGGDIEANSVVHRYFVQEGFGDFSLFDYDFMFVQMFSLLLEEEEINIFELYYKSFLGNDEELMSIFEKADFEQATAQQMKIFEDFFHFLVHLLHGEIPFFNIFSKSPYFTDHTSKKLLEQVHRKILITFLHKTYRYFPITALKSDFLYILRKDIFHEKILKDIADIDKESKTFKLKVPYQDLFDSFYLYTDPIINGKIISNVRANNKTPEIAELGNFSQSLPFLDILQQRVYEGNIISWFSSFFDKFNPKATCLVPSIVRLIVLPLKLLEHAKQLKLSRQFKEKTIFSFFGTKDFLEKLKQSFLLVDDPNVRSPLAKLINIFIPRSNIGSTINSFIAGTEEVGSMFDPISSMDPSELQKALEAQGSLSNFPPVREWDEGELICGLCYHSVDLKSENVGIPTYISRSNVNYWPVEAQKFQKPIHRADAATMRLILLLIKRYIPYAEGLNARELELMEGYVPPRLRLDFYPALTSCMHYLHRSCFRKAYSVVPGSAQEFECPICRKLSNTFIGMEKVDAASREMLQEQMKKNERFLGFLKKQGVLVSMLPDPNLRFDFYNNFMHALFPKNSTLELKHNDPASDRKILKFTSLMRTSFFQLVRNSMIYDFEAFINRSYICYKFAFVNLQSFVMKNFQFHKFFEDYNQDLAPTIFHILNHSTLMGGAEPPTMKELYSEYKISLGLEHEQMVMKMRETTAERKKKKKKTVIKLLEKHDHTRKLPHLPTDFRRKTMENFKMTKKNREIMYAYNYNQNVVKMNEMIFESNEIMFQTMRNTQTTLRRDIERPNIDMTGTLEEQYKRGRSRGSTPDDSENYKEEELFDTLQKMLLLLENETEEDFLLAFWESFLRFLLTNRMKDSSTNIDVGMIAVDFLYLRTLGIFTRTLLSEKVLKSRQNKLPEFEHMCKVIASNRELRNEFIGEMLVLTQRIIVASVIIFDFDKCMEVKNKFQCLNGLKDNKEIFLNQLLGFVKKDLTVDVILSEGIWGLKPAYRNFFGVWRENMLDFLNKTRNPFELFVKNVTEVKPLMIELPSNFNEFNSEYLPRRCDLCKEFCESCRTVLCILCGKVMCKDKCSKEKKPKKDNKDNKVRKDKKKKKRKKAKVNTFGDLMDSSDSDQVSDTSVDAEREEGDDMRIPVKPQMSTPKDGEKGASSNGSLDSIPSKTSRIKKIRVKTKSDHKISSINIITFNERPSIELDMVKNGGSISENVSTPTRQTRMTDRQTETRATERGLSSENLLGGKKIRKVKVGKSVGKVESGVKTLSFADIGTVRPMSRTRNTSMGLPSSTDRSTLKTIMGSGVKEAQGNGIQTDQTEKKKKRRRRRKGKHGNMYKHADECHKGHTVYIGIQDQSIILFSVPREVKYYEKLYVDRFGQSLNDKVNVFEEDWNSFELNPFVLKKLREAVENHTVPQLIFSIITGQVKSK